MTAHDASCLLIEIKKSMNIGFKLTEKDKSVINNIVIRMKISRPLSGPQGYALQAIYRRSQGDGKKVYREIIKR